MAPANCCLTVARVEGLKGEDPSRVLFGVGIYVLLLALAFCSRPLRRRGGGRKIALEAKVESSGNIEGAPADEGSKPELEDLFLETDPQSCPRRSLP